LTFISRLLGESEGEFLGDRDLQGPVLKYDLRFSIFKARK
jgi:hypothetical protein